ncbi:MAG: NAD(P)/FAD-dependent oxidoreductase [Acidobacteria bacterium]|nr:NAD(P)/FAD-dependent oxidoreductase [Acidobacteriota bacterium]
MFTRKGEEKDGSLPTTGYNPSQAMRTLSSRRTSLPESSTMNPDVLVVGGGPTGLATAIALRLEGFSVTLVERRLPPVDKACGEGIMPGGVPILRHLGVDLPSRDSFRFHGILYREGDTVATARFGGPPGMGVRRTTLHHALVCRACDLGVNFLWGRGLRELLPEGGRVADGSIRARWTVAADGANSGIRQKLGLDGRIRYQRLGLRRHYGIRPWSSMVEVSFADRCETYVTPIADDQVCVALLTDDVRPGFDRLLARFPHLVERLAGGQLVSEARGAGVIFRSARQVVSGRVALVGDAAVAVDAISGEGVCLGLHQAMALAHSLRHGDLAEYARVHAGLVRVTMRMTRLLLLLHRRPQLRRSVLRTFQAWPGLFTGLLAIHTRETSLAGFGARLLHLH